MQTYHSLLSALKHSPQLPAAIEELNAYWKDEQARRLAFYNDIDEDSKAEFIDGEVVMHSPAKEMHNDVRSMIDRLFRTYADVNQLGKVRSEKALITLKRNDYEPDVCFFGPQKALLITPNTLQYPAPDWVCEILSPTTARYDRGVKMRDYAANGIAEYWIIDPENRVVEIYRLEAHEYVLDIKTNTGVLRSRVITGLECPIEAIFDNGKNLLALRDILK